MIDFLSLHGFLYMFALFLSFQVLEALKGQTKPVAAPELLECMKILMTAIKQFLPLVLATHDKDGWLWSSWVANDQTQLIIDSKKEVSLFDYYFILETLTIFVTKSFLYKYLLCFSIQINVANETFKTAAFRYSFKVDLYKFHLIVFIEISLLMSNVLCCIAVAMCDRQ